MKERLSDGRVDPSDPLSVIWNPGVTFSLSVRRVIVDGAILRALLTDENLQNKLKKTLQQY